MLSCMTNKTLFAKSNVFQRKKLEKKEKNGDLIHIYLINVGGRFYVFYAVFWCGLRNITQVVKEGRKYA